MKQNVVKNKYIVRNMFNPSILYVLFPPGTNIFCIIQFGMNFPLQCILPLFNRRHAIFLCIPDIHDIILYIELDFPKQQWVHSNTCVLLVILLSCFLRGLPLSFQIITWIFILSYKFLILMCLVSSQYFSRQCFSE